MSESLIPLEYLKEYHPVNLANYDLARGISDNAACVWLIPYTLRKRDTYHRVRVKHRVCKMAHKFGIKIPTNAEHEYKVDANNVNTFWQDVIQTKMQINGIAFKVLCEGEGSPHGWHKVKRHIVVGVKMDVNRKARRILDGHKTSDPI